MEAAITLPAGPSAGLFAEFGGSMFRRCLRILRDETVAARCAESLFVRFVVHADAHGLDDRARWNWIYRVATSHALRQLSDDSRPGGASGAEGTSPPTPVQPLPDMRTLRRMDEATQGILVLSLLDGLTPDEIAEVLGVSTKLVRRRINASMVELHVGQAGAIAAAVPSRGGPATAGGDSHPSMLALDRDRDRNAEHIAGCARCRSVIEENDRMSLHFARDLAPAAVGRMAAAVRTERARRAAGPNWKRIAWLAGGFIVVAALALLVARPRPQDRGDVPYAGLKGASRVKASGIHIAVGQGTEIRPLAPEMVLHSGDRLFFRVKAERPRYLELRVHDARGERRIFPQPSAQPALVLPEQSLDVEYLVAPDALPTAPGQTVKPGQTARVWIIGLFSDQPFAVDRPPGPEIEIVPIPVDIQVVSPPG